MEKVYLKNYNHLFKEAIPENNIEELITKEVYVTKNNVEGLKENNELIQIIPELYKDFNKLNGLNNKSKKLRRKSYDYDDGFNDLSMCLIDSMDMTEPIHYIPDYLTSMITGSLITGPVFEKMQAGIGFVGYMFGALMGLVGNIAIHLSSYNVKWNGHSCVFSLYSLAYGTIKRTSYLIHDVFTYLNEGTNKIRIKKINKKIKSLEKKLKTKISKKYEKNKELKNEEYFSNPINKIKKLDNYLTEDKFFSELDSIHDKLIEYSKIIKISDLDKVKKFLTKLEKIINSTSSKIKCDPKIIQSYKKEFEEIYKLHIDYAYFNSEQEEIRQIKQHEKDIAELKKLDKKEKKIMNKILVTE